MKNVNIEEVFERSHRVFREKNVLSQVEMEKIVGIIEYYSGTSANPNEREALWYLLLARYYAELKLYKERMEAVADVMAAATSLARLR